MKKTVYKKFILTYILFALLSIFTIRYWSLKATSETLVSDKAAVLYNNGNVIVREYLANDINKIADSPQIIRQIQVISSILHSRIWIIDKSGRILYDSLNLKLGSVIDGFDITDFDNNYYSVGKFYNNFDNSTLSVFIPITGEYSIDGYLLIHKDTTSINDSGKSVHKVIYITFAIIFMLSLIILIIFTFIVYLPLKKISVASSEYAKGNLTYDGLKNFTSEDEIGRLGVSLNYMASELNNLEEDQKKFIANISHDFRSPLTSIKGYIEAMKDGTIPFEMQNKYLDIVLFETERLTKLTQSLLSLNAWDTKSNRLELTDFSLYDFMKPILATFEGKCEKKHIIIDFVIGSKSYMVNADKEKIQQVIYNLIDNAIKFSHPDSTITITVKDINEKIFISIKDTGIGIPKNSLNKIWERFYKTDLSRGKDKTGTGLGLSITKEIIQAHNENINVISTEGVGTEFIFTLKKSKSK